MEKGKHELRIAFLMAQMNLAEKAAKALDLSHRRNRGVFPATRELSDEELIQLDALTSRFARLSDIIIQKVLRGMDAIELVDEGSMIDRINRAQKRGIIESAKDWFNIRELRNQIAHEYIVEDVDSLFKDVLSYTPIVLRCVKTAQAYIEEKKFQGPACPD